MRNILINTWTLFFGFSFICLGHGLQGTLLGVRATIEGFTFIETGFVMAGYCIGYLSGSLLIPIFINQVGHIRVFAALASLASIAILLHSIFLNPYFWFFIRILSGLSLAGIFIIMESWLNDKADNNNRGKLLSIYLIIIFLFSGLGNFLLNLSNPINFDLFILISVLLSFALLPILLSATNPPDSINPKRIGIREMYIISPLGFVSAIIIGLSHSVVFGYGAVYATAKSFSTFNISFFMFIVSICGALFQYPIGYFSDKIDRRIILIGVTFTAALLSILIIIFSYVSLNLFFLLVALFAGMCLPLYSLAIAHMNDYIEKEKIVALSSSFTMLVGAGAVFGPILVAIFMNFFNADGFFLYLFFVHLILGLFGIYRMSQREKPADIESQYYPLPRNISPAGMELNPKVEINNDE